MSLIFLAAVWPELTSDFFNFLLRASLKIKMKNGKFASFYK